MPGDFCADTARTRVYVYRRRHREIVRRARDEVSAEYSAGRRINAGDLAACARQVFPSFRGERERVAAGSSSLDALCCRDFYE